METYLINSELEPLDDYTEIASTIAVPHNSDLKLDDIINKNPSELSDEEATYLINFKATVMARNAYVDTQTELGNTFNNIRRLARNQSLYDREAKLASIKEAFNEQREIRREKFEATKELLAAVKAKAKAAMEEVNGTDEQEDAQG